MTNNCDVAFLYSLLGPSTAIKNFSSQTISCLGINSHHVQRAEIANFTNNFDIVLLYIVFPYSGKVWQVARKFG